MSCSFYFLLGQAITFLGVSWNVTMLINLVAISIIEIVYYPSFLFQPFSMLIGWLSIAMIPSYFLESKTKTFLFTVPTQTLMLLYFCEVVVFGMITSFIFYDDKDTVSWIFLIFFHIIYVLCVTVVDTKLEKNFETIENEGYETVFAACILSSDFVFLFFTLFDWSKVGDSIIILTAGIASFLFSFLTVRFFKKENLSVL